MTTAVSTAVWRARAEMLEDRLRHVGEYLHGNPFAPVGDQWELEVDKMVRSANHYRHSEFAYTSDTDAWEKVLSAEVQRMSVWAAEGKRRCFFTRLIGPRGQEFDLFNLYGGLKSVVDALVRLNVLIDDRPKYFEGYANQRRHPYHGLRIRIEDLIPEP